MLMTTVPDLENLQEFINSIPQPCLCIDQQLRVQVINGEFAKLFGSTHFSPGLPITSLLHLALYTEQPPKTIRQLTQNWFTDETRDKLSLLTSNDDLITVIGRISPVKIKQLSGYFLITLQRNTLQGSDQIFNIYKSVFNKLEHGLFIANFNSTGKGQHGQFIDVNDVACKQLGYQRDELLSMNARMLNPESNTETIKAIGRNIKRDGLARFHAIHVGKDGTHHSVGVIAKLIEFNDQAYVLSICDYRSKSYSQENVEQSRFGRLLEVSWDEIYVFTTDTLTISQANTGALDNLGYSRFEISQLKITDLMQDISENTFKRLTESLFNGIRSQIVLESVFKRKDESQYPVEIRIQLSHSEVPPVYLANVQNISERKANEQDLLYMANHDALTGLFNRNAFISKLKESLEQCKRSDSLLAIMFMDLDGFKYINDTMGHDTGDQLIIETARRLSASVRSTDIVSRLGGDEFTAILTHIKHTDDIITVAEKIIKKISEPCELNGFNIQTSCSLGITVYPFTDADNAYTLIKQADTAMYQAKASGKNTYAFYAATLAQKERDLRQLESDLKQAFLNQEFNVHYQAKVNLESRKIFGAEALIRWPTSKYPNISPADFIPIMESSELIQHVDMWVLEQVCTNLKQWLKLDPELIISINLSAKHFKSDTVMENVKSILNKTGVPAENLEIEITEGVLISQTEKAESILSNLTELGFTISLDDFGSGYSSLSYLKQLPINRLKIDRAFVVDLETNSDSRAIIEAIINMADSMDLKIIAEGIENEYQVNLLTELNCFEGQGYLFYRPCPADQFSRQLDENN